MKTAAKRSTFVAWAPRSYSSRIDDMAMRKLSITLPEELAEMVKRQAEEEGTSVSAVIAEELAAVARRRAGEEAVRWFEEVEGPFTAEERAAARAILDAADEHRRKMELAARREAG
jgi:metal-responsive CopG/Arc/MetJ family transcriptional regulator